MKKKIMAFVGVLAVMAAAVAAPALPVHADAKTQVLQGINVFQGGPTDLKVSISNIVNVFLFILGAVAVIMIIIGGFRYVVSGGESGAITSAKNTIFYAVIGLVVAILAYAIVNFVVTNIK